MPFLEKSKMSVKLEFISLAMKDGANMRALCRNFAICPTTGYKWIGRYRHEGADGLRERSRRPKKSPSQTRPEVEAAVIQVRDEHPRWGGRKIKRYLENGGHRGMPSASTITEILRRASRLDAEGVAVKKWKRFERETPNELWQMDFKGHFPLRGGRRCHPLTVLDDHSRFALALEACGNERWNTVRKQLRRAFRRYGLPDAIITDNSPPWGVPHSPESFTALGVWLIRLGVLLKKAGAYHPQTNGKVERFHRTLKAEILQGREFKGLDECQDAFDAWRYVYNFERPHQAIGLVAPSQRFKISDRAFPEALPEIVYGDDDYVRKVQDGGWIHFEGHKYRVGRAFKRLPVAVRPTAEDGIFDVVCVRQVLLHINLFAAPPGGAAM